MIFSTLDLKICTKFCSILNIHQPTINMEHAKWKIIWMNWMTVAVELNLSNWFEFEENTSFYMGTSLTIIENCLFVCLFLYLFLLEGDEMVFSFEFSVFILDEKRQTYPCKLNSIRIFTVMVVEKTNRITLKWLQNRWHLTNYTIKQRVVTVPVAIICDFSFHSAWKMEKLKSTNVQNVTTESKWEWFVLICKPTWIRIRTLKTQKWTNFCLFIREIKKRVRKTIVRPIDWYLLCGNKFWTISSITNVLFEHRNPNTKLI